MTDPTQFRDLVEQIRSQRGGAELPYTCLLGIAIATLRRENDITQVELARRSGVSQSTVSRIELGEGDLTAPQLDALATALGVRPSAIFDAADAARSVLKEADVAVPSKPSKATRDAMTGAGMAMAGGLLGGPIGLLAGSIMGVLLSNSKTRL